ncbi:MAG: hypothetical protein ACLSE4_02215 [Clostridium sp.]
MIKKFYLRFIWSEYAQELKSLQGNSENHLEGERNLSLADLLLRGSGAQHENALRHVWKFRSGQDIRKDHNRGSNKALTMFPCLTRRKLLIISFHGFFSLHWNVSFLRKLLAVLPDVEFYHTGGFGLRRHPYFFGHIREHICSRVLPIKHGRADQYDHYIQRVVDEIKPKP